MEIEFHFDFGSPNAYLSHLVMPELEARIGQPIAYVPVLLGGVFKATNNVSPGVSMQGILNKPEYAQIETERFLQAHQITAFKRNPDFPINTLMLMRGAVFAQTKDYCFDYINAVYHHMWAVPKKMDELEIIHAALVESNLPADEIFEGASLPEVKSALITNTERSVARGNFGSPTFFVGDAMFFGKDKLGDFEAEILARTD